MVGETCEGCGDEVLIRKDLDGRKLCLDCYSKFKDGKIYPSEETSTETYTGVSIKKRNIILMYLLIFVTFGIYAIYWHISTKNEMNNEFKTDIPTGWLLIIPIANIYWIYKYAEGFSTKVEEDDNTVLWFLIFWLIGIVTPAIVQLELNKYADDPDLLRVKQRGDRRCPNCGRVIPFDSVICPYCGKRFESFL